VSGRHMCTCKVSKRVNTADKCVLNRLTIAVQELERAAASRKVGDTLLYLVKQNVGDSSTPTEPGLTGAESAQIATSSSPAHP
jgi:hypothetical protein